MPALWAPAATAIAIVAAMAAAASAADLPVPGGPSYIPQVYRPVLYDWTGLYFGVHVGAGAMQDVVTTTTATLLQPSGAVTNLSPYAIIGGGQVGANLQLSSIVFGAEAAWTDSGISGQQVVPTLQTGFGGLTERSRSSSLWYATATGRIGYAANDLLIYAKGGAAWMRVDYTQAVLVGGPQSQQSIYDTRRGFVVGGGLEYAFNENLSARLEYDFLDFGTRSYTFNNLSFTPTPGALTALSLPVSVKSVTSMLTLGVSYRFNWGGGGPLAAKY